MKTHCILIALLCTITPLTLAAQTGTIEATIYNQNTEKPLTNAKVHLLPTNISQKSDANGKVQFTAIPPGTYTLTITHPRFTTPTKTNIHVTPHHTTQTKIFLGETQELQTIRIEGQRIPPTISKKNIHGSELLRIPGTGTDALKGLTTLPSIGIPNDFFGILYIRGSEPGSNLYYLDRTPLGYPFHWGGTLSTISSETINTIDIYAGGYGTQFGLDSQAVLDIQTRNTIQTQLNAKLNLNIWYAEALLEKNIGNNGYLSASARRSYLDLIVGPILENETGSQQQFPYLSDYQLKFAYALTEKHHLTLNAFAATDHFHFTAEETTTENDQNTHTQPNKTETPVPAPEPFTAGILFKNGFNGQGIHLRSKFNQNLKSHLSLTRSLNFLHIDLNATAAENITYDQDGNITHRYAESAQYQLHVDVPVYTLRQDLTYQLTQTLQLEPGVLLTVSPANSTEHSSYPIFSEQHTAENTPEEIPSTDPANLEHDNDTIPVIPTIQTNDYEFGHDLQRTEAYLQARYEPTEILACTLGLRIDYLNVIQQTSIQPRGNVSIKLPTGSHLRFAYGHYQQSPLLSQLLSKNGNPTLKSSLTQHYILELTHQLSSQTEIKCAAYHKNSQKLITEDATHNYLNQGYGYVEGIEAFLRHRIPHKFFGWISYAYTHAERKNKPNATYQPYLFNNTHIVSIVANYNFNPDFEIGAKWQYLSGTAETPISSIVLIQDPITRGLNPLFANIDKALHAKLTPYHRLDLRIGKTWNIFDIKVGGFIELLNAYNRKNTIQFLLQKGTFEIQGEEIEIDEQEIGESGQIPRLIYFGLTLDF